MIKTQEQEKDFIGMEKCFICGEVKSLLLDRRLKKTLPKEAIYNKVPCDKCLKVMKEGVFFIGVRNGENGENPYRTGQIIAIKEDKIKEIINDKNLLNDVLKKRICYIEEEVLLKLGLINEKGELRYNKK